MKKFRKLIPALCMLLVSALFVGTSTYAWFSMNTSVSATNMQVTAKSDAIYLQIKGEKDADYSQTGNAGVNATLLPVKHVSLAKAKLDTASNWQYAYSNDPANAMSGVTADSYKTVEENKLNSYVTKTTFNVKVYASENGETANKAYNLYVKDINLPEAAKGYKAILVCGDNVIEYTESKANQSSTGNILASEVTTAGVDVTVYLYIDGDQSGVYTNNIHDLQNLACSFVLDSSTTAPAVGG